MSSFSLTDLCDLADVTPRTVRFYITQGLLRPPTGAGPAARYDDGHLYRLRLIRHLQREHLPLVEIRRRLDALSDGDVERLASEPAPATDSAAAYVSRVLGARGIGGGREASRPAWRGTSPGSPVPPLGPFELPEPSMARVSEHAEPYAPAAMAAPPEPAATGPESVRSQWERIVLTPEIELHVRRPLGRHQNRRVDRLLESARAIFKEEGE